MRAVFQKFVLWLMSPCAPAASTCGRADGHRGIADKGDAAPAPELQGLPRQPAAVDAVLRDGVRVGGAVQHHLVVQRHVSQRQPGALQMAKNATFAQRDEDAGVNTQRMGFNTQRRT